VADFPTMGVPDTGDTAWMLVCSTAAAGTNWACIFGLRATPDDEEMGIDEAEHAETAYDFGSVGSGSALSMAGAGKEA
jgi:hypothetical protein